MKVCVCAASRKTDECNCPVIWKMLRQRVLRRVQMYIDEDPGNRLLNKSKIILI